MVYFIFSGFPLRFLLNNKQQWAWQNIFPPINGEIITHGELIDETMTWNIARLWWGHCAAKDSIVVVTLIKELRICLHLQTCCWPFTSDRGLSDLLLTDPGQVKIGSCFLCRGIMIISVVKSINTEAWPWHLMFGYSQKATMQWEKFQFCAIVN